MELTEIFKKINVKKSSHNFAIYGLYISEKLLENNDFKIIGAIRPNRIKSNAEDIKEKWFPSYLCYSSFLSEHVWYKHL